MSLGESLIVMEEEYTNTIIAVLIHAIVQFENATFSGNVFKNENKSHMRLFVIDFRMKILRM